MDQDNLKRAGLKNTLPRRKILEIMENATEHHMTAEDIYKAFIEQGEDIGLATVYRVLTQFEEAGLVVKHHFEGGQSIFEQVTDEHHDHLVCVKCGDVKEFVDDAIEARQEQIAKEANFIIADHNLTIYGTCPNCRVVLR